MYNSAISKKVNDTKGGMEAWIMGKKYEVCTMVIGKVSFIQKIYLLAVNHSRLMHNGPDKDFIIGSRITEEIF